MRHSTPPQNGWLRTRSSWIIITPNTPLRVSESPPQPINRQNATETDTRALGEVVDATLDLRQQPFLQPHLETIAAQLRQQLGELLR
jgi:hypothetical protein